LVAFVQLFIIEILYFSPRYPLNVFFGPIISKIWSPAYLEYPLNFLLLPKMFQYSQMPIYIFVSSFFIAVAVGIIAAINADQKVNIGAIIKKTFSSYVHLIVAAIISFALVAVLFKLFGLVFTRAAQIRSTTGHFFMIKSIVMGGAPYFQLLLSIFATTLFAYVIPAIVIDNKKVFSALMVNFKSLKGAFWFTFFIVLTPSLLFMPILLLRNSIPLDFFAPELRLMTLVFSVFVMVLIDAIIYTAVTSFYLVKKEENS